MSTTPSSDDERALFEAYRQGNLKRAANGCYESPYAEDDWLLWKEARASLSAAQVPSLEEIALRAHEHCFKAYEMPKEGVQLYMFDAERLAKVIAALSQPSEQEQG